MAEICKIKERAKNQYFNKVKKTDYDIQGTS